MRAALPKFWFERNEGPHFQRQVPQTILADVVFWYNQDALVGHLTAGGFNNPAASFQGLFVAFRVPERRYISIGQKKFGQY